MRQEHCRPLDRAGIFEVLRCAPHCVLAVAENDQPYAVPMYYFWKFSGGRLWFLLCSDKCGCKMSCMRNNSKVALLFELPSENCTKTVVAKGKVLRFCNEDCEDDDVIIEILATSVTGREHPNKCHERSWLR